MAELKFTQPTLSAQALSQYREVLKAFSNPQEAVRSTVANFRASVRAGYDLGVSLFEHDYSPKELDEIFEESWAPAEDDLIALLVEPIVELGEAPQIKIDGGSKP